MKMKILSFLEEKIKANKRPMINNRFNAKDLESWEE